ncbi:MAG: hypothetical protein ACLFQV_14160 [Vulcanimicrobiota bacterium]
MSDNQNNEVNAEQKKQPGRSRVAIFAIVLLILGVYRFIFFDRDMQQDADLKIEEGNSAVLQHNNHEFAIKISDGENIYDINSKNRKAVIPAGAYEVVNITLLKNDEQGNEWKLATNRFRQKVNITPDKTYQLKCDEPLGMDVIQKGGGFQLVFTMTKGVDCMVFKNGRNINAGDFIIYNPSGRETNRKFVSSGCHGGHNFQVEGVKLEPGSRVVLNPIEIPFIFDRSRLEKVFLEDEILNPQKYSKCY